MKKAKAFYFNNAEYTLGDGKGGELLIKVDYAKNKYVLAIPKGAKKKPNGLAKEAKIIAKDLLSRKRNINFIDKLIK